MQIGLLVASVGCVGWAHARLPISQATALEASFVPGPKQARALALGFDAVLADFHWLEAVQIVGSAGIVPGRYPSFGGPSGLARRALCSARPLATMPHAPT